MWVPDDPQSNAASSPPAPACIPPCGYQPAASIFKCATCRFEHCPFPLDCPVQDKWVQEDEAITLLCSVPFATPAGSAVTWMFAKDLRTQDLAHFEELQGSVSGPFSLTIQEPVPGTVACCLGPISQPLVRKYFYINVSERGVEEEKLLQARFRSVLHWSHHEAAVHHMALLRLGLAFGSIVLLMLLVVVAIWQCWRLRGRLNTQTSSRHHDPSECSKCLDSP
ncbi:sperm acrosome membrane-associated protein 6 [Dryobates pubescens]|uniref:sperm acrosome membrane-associated protein 6 n=1 Tax=Dryobates pubescens TaxID=118200 RepID=UPI0023B91380|nr:sperm acrosome membrane-associated protein 6 [Dryobates pubescens]